MLPEAKAELHQIDTVRERITMLTDRQQKFYDRIVKLSEDREVPRKERKFIKKAKKNIDEGRRFGDSINAMNLSLKIYQENIGVALNVEVEKLCKDLIGAYGQPDFRQLSSMETKGSFGTGFSSRGWLP